MNRFFLGVFDNAVQASDDSAAFFSKIVCRHLPQLRSFAYEVRTRMREPSEFHTHLCEVHEVGIGLQWLYALDVTILFNRQDRVLIASNVEVREDYG